MGKTVSATLKLFDSFSSTLDKVNGTMSKTAAKMTNFREQVEKPIGGGGGMFKSMLGAQLVGGAVTKGLGMAQSAIGGLMGDLDESSKAWQTFQGNMEQLEMPTDKIADAKKDMQDYATQTIYSASDMASTYSQLAAVGIKNTGSLVKGFGGLAAASTDPTQAMKTLSQQATQMAAKPKVQWQDFKLMLEQTPAGIAAVAKTMGKSASQLVKDVQDGTIKTQEFFDAVSKTGTNKQFSKMATEFKTVGQAVDGLKEGLTNKLQPVFDRLSKRGIALVSNLSDKINTINFEKIADKVMAFTERVWQGFIKVGQGIGKVWQGFKDSGAISSVSSAFSAIGGAIRNIAASLSGGAGEGLKNLGQSLGGITSKVSGVIKNIANAIANMSPEKIQQIAGYVLKAGEAMLAFKVASVAFKKGLAVYDGVAHTVTVVKALAGALGSLGGMGTGGKAGKAAATVPAAPNVSGLSAWSGIVKNVGVILAIGVTMKLIASSFKDMASVNISWGQFGKNLAQMGTFLAAAAISLGIIGGTVMLFPPIAAALAIGAGVFIGLAATMSVVSTGLKNFAENSVGAIEAVNDIKIDKNFGSKLGKILEGMSGLAVVGGFTGALGAIAAPFAMLGGIGFVAIAITISKIADFAKKMSTTEIPNADSLKPKFEQVQKIAQTLSSFKMDKMGNVSKVFSALLEGWSVGNVIGTFKKISDFVQQINKMPAVSTATLKEKFKMLSDSRETMNKAVQGSSTGGINIDAMVNSWFGKGDTSNVVKTFEKVADFVKKISALPTIDASSLAGKFKTVKDMFNKLKSFSSEKFDWGSIVDSLKSFFGKSDTSNIINSFSKVTNLTGKINNMPTLNAGAIDTKFKAIKDVFNKLKSFKIEPYSGDTGSLDSYKKVTGSITKLTTFITTLSNATVVDVGGKLDQIKKTVIKLSQFTVPAPVKGMDKTLGDVKKVVIPLANIANSLAGIAQIADLAPVNSKIDQIKMAINKVSTLQITKMAAGLSTSIAEVKPVIANIVSMAQSLQSLGGIIINAGAVAANLDVIKSVVNNGAWSAIQTGLSKISGLSGTIQEGIASLSSLKTLVDKINAIPVVSETIGTNVDNIQKAIDKFAGMNFAADFSGKAAEFAGAISGLLSSLSTIGSSFVTVGTQWATQLAQGFTVGTAATQAAAMAIVMTITAALNSLATSAAGAMARVTAAINGGMAQAVAAVNSQSGALQSAGVNFVQGFINGITSQIGAAASAAASMAKAASSAAKANLDIHSPSRVMRDQVGKYFTLGFAKGITDHTPAAQQASTDMSNAAVSSSGAGDLVSAASTGGTGETGGRSVSIQIGAGAFQIALPDGSQQSLQNLVAALEQYFVELENGSLQYS